MNSTPYQPVFHVVPGTIVNEILNGSQGQVMNLIRQAYISHASGCTINPSSYFLRFPGEPRNRIIALPAVIQDDGNAVSGIKWIGSYPGNVAAGLPRASAVIVLNDIGTGYPFALMEAATISSNRTAASAVLAAECCSPEGERANHIAFIGAGIIARTILSTMINAGWPIDSISIHDNDQPSAEAFSEFAAERMSCSTVTVCALEEALAAGLVCFATSAGNPYVTDPNAFRPGQIILNISLRDIAPEIILSSDNILDDVDHCLKENTSPHLAEQMTGGRDFVTGTIADLALGTLSLNHQRPVIVSPFGLGVLDIVLARYVLAIAKEQGEAIEIPNFFGELDRWPTNAS